MIGRRHTFALAAALLAVERDEPDALEALLTTARSIVLEERVPVYQCIECGQEFIGDARGAGGRRFCCDRHRYRWGKRAQRAREAVQA